LLSENLKAIDHREDLQTGKEYRRDLRETVWVGVNWLNLAQDRE
jgi:hypothetical protein